jgi:hypothetical protein
VGLHAQHFHIGDLHFSCPDHLEVVDNILRWPLNQCTREAIDAEGGRALPHPLSHIFENRLNHSLPVRTTFGKIACLQPPDHVL